MRSPKPNKTARKTHSLPRQTASTLVIAALVSLLVHIISIDKVGTGGRSHRDLVRDKKDQVKIRIVDNRKKDNQAPEHVIETRQEETEAPKEADHLGPTDHIAKKETRVSDAVERKRADDAGVAGSVAKQNQKQVTQSTTVPQNKTPGSKNPSTIKSRMGTLSFGSATKREKYEALLPQYGDMKNQMAEGYQSYVDDKIAEGDRIDINTKQYRYIGYMTGMRKAIELVWNYPIDAASRGLQGEVELEFQIRKDGQASRIRVVKSSGYDVLDQAIVEAIRLASPFSPLPDNMDKDKILITGSFRYVLNTFGHH